MEKKDIDLKYYAKVHSIESFGTVDGPGIRFVLFLQGCHLQCKYCHNRDTWDMNGGEYKSLDDIFEKILKYKNYIYPNGGVTVTGGEPLLQVKFLIQLFEKLKKENIHTCIDTSGMAALTPDIKKLLSLTDLVLLDIKHINSDKCKNLVGPETFRAVQVCPPARLHRAGICLWHPRHGGRCRLHERRCLRRRNEGCAGCRQLSHRRRPLGGQ